jgi:hypothetical protein
MEKSMNINPHDNQMYTDTITMEIGCIKRLREDVLLLRFHLARRTDLARIIDPGVRLSSEAALKSSLEILSNVEHGKMPPIGHIAAASSALLDAVDRLVTAARLAQEEDGTGEEPLPVTPESLRASLPQSDIDHVLGIPATQGKSRETAPEARGYITRKCFWTIFWFVIAVCVHTAIVFWSKKILPAFAVAASPEVPAKSVMITNFLIPFSGFFWALVGSYVFILMRFRRFGAAYAFDPAQAKIFKARILSGSITTSVLLFFIFGGEKPWAENWAVDLPLWGFIIGYAGKLQVDILSRMVERVQNAIQSAVGTKTQDRRRNLPGQGVAADQNKTSTTADIPSEPKTEDPEAKTAGKNSERTKSQGRGES